MRVKISTQPISTSRSPRKGSSPVVSVSRMISRMRLKTGKSESGSPSRHFNSLVENVPNSCAHGVETVGGIHHEIGTPAFLRVRQLPSEDGVELFARHVVARQDALALDFRRGRDHHHRIDALLAAGL